MAVLSQYPQDATLRDGTAVLIRAIRPDDKHRLLEGLHRLTGKSVYYRFLGARPELTEPELRYFTEIDFVHHVALVVAIPDKTTERPVGVGRYIELKDDTAERIAEIAFTVADEHQHIGVGTLLFEHIVTLAQQNGMTRLQADVLPGNRTMLDILRRSGFTLETTTQGGVMHIEFGIRDRHFNRYSTEIPLPDDGKFH